MYIETYEQNDGRRSLAKDESVTMGTDLTDSLVTDRRGLSSGLQVHWKGSQKVLRQLEEFVAFLHDYQKRVDATRQTHNSLVN